MTERNKNFPNEGKLTKHVRKLEKEYVDIGVPFTIRKICEDLTLDSANRHNYDGTYGAVKQINEHFVKVFGIYLSNRELTDTNKFQHFEDFKNEYFKTFEGMHYSYNRKNKLWSETYLKDLDNDDKFVITSLLKGSKSRLERSISVGNDPFLSKKPEELLSSVNYLNQIVNDEIIINLCQKCGKELQEEWICCPFCATSVIDRDGYINRQKKIMAK